jgi:2-phospho-L-lactate guanylyltransferase
MTADRSTPEAGAALEPLHVVVPLRTLSGGKARLGGALDAEEREELVLGMLIHTLSVLDGWVACDHVHLVSPDPALASFVRSTDQGLTVHRQGGEGLNTGVALGVSEARVRGANSVLVLPGDLPQLSAASLDEMLLATDAGLAAAAGGPVVAIAPSDAGGGTNALLLCPPDAIVPAFGPDSFEAHLREAKAVEAAVQVVHYPMLGFDLDTPEDLERLDPVRLRELMDIGRTAVERVSA